MRRTTAEIVRQSFLEARKPRNFALDNLDLSGKTVCWGSQEEAAKLAQQASLMPLNLDIETQRRMATKRQRSQSLIQEGEADTSEIPATTAVAAALTHHQHPPRPPPPARPLFETPDPQLQRGPPGLSEDDGKAMDNDTPQQLQLQKQHAPLNEARGWRDSLEYIVQPDLVQRHALLVNVNKGMLRQLNRPKLPLKAARKGLPWQFQISTAAHKGRALDTASLVAAMPSTGIATAADLTPSEGKLVLLEYCEERPLVQVSRGMRTKVGPTNLFRRWTLCRCCYEYGLMYVHLFRL